MINFFSFFKKIWFLILEILVFSVIMIIMTNFIKIKSVLEFIISMCLAFSVSIFISSAFIVIFIKIKEKITKIT